MELNRYFFTRKEDDDHRVILKPEKGMNVHGIVTGRSGFPDGSMVTTSTVEKVKESSIVTYSGSEYELGDQHPDFVELQRALEEGTPVITNWDISRKESTKLEGKNFLTEEPISGVVVNQDGNYITLDTPDGEVEYLVIWRNMNRRVRAMMECTGGVAGLRYSRYSKDFRDQFSFKCVPILT